MLANKGGGWIVALHSPETIGFYYVAKGYVLLEMRVDAKLLTQWKTEDKPTLL